MSSVVLISGEHIHGRMLIEAMNTGGVPPALVVNEVGTKRAEKASQFLVNEFDRPPFLEELTQNLQRVDQFDGPEAIDLIRGAEPRFLINGGCGIMRENLLTLATPLNAHPGLLPEFRGLDPVLWAALERASIGATVHVMTKGIDAGALLVTRQMPWRNARTLLETRLQCMRWCGELLAEYLKTPERYQPLAQDERKARYFGGFPPERYMEAEANLVHYVAKTDGNIFLDPMKAAP